jgi:folate-binding protein YgfZ
MENAMTPTNDTTKAHRHAGIFIPESTPEIISVTGEDRATFLQGIVSQDIANAKTNDVLYTLFLDPKAHILFEAWVAILPEEILLLPPTGTGEGLLAHLKKYLFFRTKAKLGISTDRFEVAHVAGPKLLLILSGLLESGDSAIRVFNGGGYVLFHPSTFQKETPIGPMADLLIPKDSSQTLKKTLAETIVSAGGAVLSEEGFKTYKLEMGMPSYPSELNDQHFPAEAGLESVGVSFTKGCFVGQEPVTRIKFQGKLNRGLAGFVLSGKEPIASLPETIFDTATQTHVGTLTSIAFSAFRGETIGLGYLKNSHSEPGTELALSSGRTLHVAPLP